MRRLDIEECKYWSSGYDNGEEDYKFQRVKELGLEIHKLHGSHLVPYPM
jgi:hypothetical protein